MSEHRVCTHSQHKNIFLKIVGVFYFQVRKKDSAYPAHFNFNFDFNLRTGSFMTRPKMMAMLYFYCLKLKQNFMFLSGKNKLSTT